MDKHSDIRAYGGAVIVIQTITPGFRTIQKYHKKKKVLGAKGNVYSYSTSNSEMLNDFLLRPRQWLLFPILTQHFIKRP